MSLLLGTEIGVLFSPSQPGDTFREALKNESYGDANFWAGIVLCISIGLTLSTLVANFTAWAIIGAVSPHNSHAILRSSVGFDAAQLPARLVILSIYCFVAWVMMFVWILIPSIWGYLIALFPVVLIAYIVILYSSFGRLVIYSKAMQQKEIFKGEEDNSMAPRRLFEELLKRAEKEKDKQTPLPLFYRSKRELSAKISDLRSREQDQLEDMGFGSSHATQYVSKILGASGHHDAHLVDDLMRSSDEGDIEESNGVPQNPSDTEQPQEGEDTHGTLQSSSHSSGKSLSGLRREYSDSTMKRGCSGTGESRSSQMSRGKGESSQSMLQSNPMASLSSQFG